MNTEIDRKIAVILVADVVGYSKHMEIDENATLKAYVECEKLLEHWLKKFKGSIFNTAGDSALAEFPSAVAAVECGVAFQNDIKKRNESDKTEVKLEFRIGINMGDVLRKKGNLFGDGVNIAARLEAIAQPNGISISKSVYDLVVPKTKMTFNDLGVQKVKQNEFHAFDIILDPNHKRVIKKGSKLYLSILAASLVVLFISFIFMTVFDRSKKSNEKLSVSRTLGDRLLISKIINLNKDASLDYISSGIERQLVSNLASTSFLPLVMGDERKKLISKGLHKERASDDDISFILEGSTQVIGEKFRVNVELIDIFKKEALWSYSEDFKLQEVFAAQDEIEFQVRKGIQTNLTMGKQFSDALVKYFGTGELYKKVVSILVSNKKNNERIYFNQVQNFEEIKAKNPKNSMAQLFFAIALYNEMAVNFENYSENRDLVLASIREAINLDPLNYMAYPVLAFFEYILSDETDQKHIIAQKGLSKDPENYFNLIWTSHAYQISTKVVNKFPSKIIPSSDLLRKALDIAPFASESTRIFLFRSLIREKKIDQAYDLVKNMLEKGSTRSTFWGTLCSAFLKYEYEKDKLGARELLDRYVEEAGIEPKDILLEFDQYPYRHYDGDFFGLTFLPKLADILDYEFNATFGLVKKSSE